MGAPCYIKIYCMHSRKHLLVFLILSVLFLSARVSRAQILINEYSATNLHTIEDNYGSHGDWLELYNITDQPVDMAGFGLTDNKNNLSKWKFPAGVSIPAKGFLIVWLSGRNEFKDSHVHANFKLTQTKTKKEQLVLTDRSGKTLNEITIQLAPEDHTWSRTTDGAGNWGISNKPTPGAFNEGSVQFKRMLNKPVASKKAGFYKDSILVTLNAPENGVTIRFTLDGSLPGITSPEYTGPITIRNTTVLKAIAYAPEADVLPSLLEFQSYFINVLHTLPVVSISGYKLDTLAFGFRDTDEIIRIDTIEWEGEVYIIPIYKRLEPIGSFEYFGTDGNRNAATYGEFNSHGQDSWVLSQRSIDFVSRDEMGYNDVIEERLFDLSDRGEFQRIILRAAGDDNFPADYNEPNLGSAHVRDAYIQNMVKRGGLHLDVRTAAKCIVYLNGQYWGVYDLREKVDDHDYTDFYYGQDKYHLQYLQTWWDTWAEYGGQKALDDWQTLNQFVMQNDMTQEQHFKKVTDELDLLSMIDYFAVNSFTVCSDWLNYNTGWWRGTNPEGTHKKWGFTLWDNDATFGHYINYTGIPETGPKAALCNVETLTADTVDLNGHMRLFNKLLTNKECRRIYYTRLNELYNKVFNCDTMLARLDEMVASIIPEMPMHCTKWNGQLNDWEQNVEQLKNYILSRCEYLEESFRDCYQLTGPYVMTVDALPPDAGSVKINEAVISKFPYTGKYFGAVTHALVAQPKAGYFFDQWKSDALNIFPAPKDFEQTLDIAGPIAVTAVFESTTSTTSPNSLGIQLFPTITSDQLTVLRPENVRTQIHGRLLNMHGKVIANLSKQLDNNGAVTFSAQAVGCKAAGQYWLHFWDERESVVLKFTLVEP